MRESQAGPAVMDDRKPSRAFIGWYVLFLGLAFLVIVGAWIASQFVSSPLQISKETTYITAPLRPDGEQIDYFAAMEREVYPANFATEDNGFRLIIQRLVPAPETQRWQLEQTCEKLGLDPLLVHPDLNYQDPSDYVTGYVAGADFGEADQVIVAQLRARYRPDALEHNMRYESVAGSPSEEDDRRDACDLLGQRFNAPWTLDDLPMMERWLEENSPALDVIGAAVRKPIFRIPLTRQNEDEFFVMILLTDVQRMRAFARGLSARAYHRIGTGDIDGAMEDIITCKRLGRHVGHGATLVDLLVGIAIEGIADSIGAAGSLEHPPSRDQLERFREAYEHLPPRATLAEKMRCERFSALEILQVMSRGGEKATAAESLFGLPAEIGRIVRAIGLDWNVVARRVNAHYDAMIEHGIEPVRPQFRPTQFISRAARSELVADGFAALLLPAAEAVGEAIHRSQCSENMKRITLAMLLYEHEHRALPPAVTVNEHGEPLHSWRALLLPYLGQQELYDKVRLDEPWDSEHNRTLHEADVPCYQCPTAALAPGRTTYAVVFGEMAAFDATGQGRRLDSLGRHSADMILLVERRADTCWMDPGGDVAYDDARLGFQVAASGLRSGHPGGAYVGLRSTAALFLSQNADVERRLLGLPEGTSEYLPSKDVELQHEAPEHDPGGSMSPAEQARKLKVLFLCTGNSCRSQMAEGWARQLKGDVIEAYSAGVQTHGLNPHAVRVMAEAGVDISQHRSKHVDELQDVVFDHVITVCGHAHESCPVFSTATRVTHVGFDDPPRLAREAATEEEALGHYRRVRDEIRAFVETLPESLAAQGQAP